MQDKRSTHKSARLYETFPATEARRLVERHDTPEHGSWLDMVEAERSALPAQCLNRRIQDKQMLIEQVAAWEGHRNNNHAKADCQFTSRDARIKLKRLYPAL